jgi:FixJ family two-component response regulator
MFETRAVVAVVDDDGEMRRAMQRVLETEGYVTEAFGTAEDFLASGAATRAACLVLDVHLPGMPGTELYGRLHAMGSRLPAVFVSAHAIEETDDCLVKPFPAEKLIQAVERRLRGSKAQ